MSSVTTGALASRWDGAMVDDMTGRIAYAGMSSITTGALALARARVHGSPMITAADALFESLVEDDPETPALPAAWRSFADADGLQIKAGGDASCT